MLLQKLCFICAILAVNTQDSDSGEQEFPTESENEKKLSDTILALLEHYKQPDPVGLPKELVPDPCPMADTQQYMPFGITMYFKNTSAYGTSKFRISYMNFDIARMEVQAALRVDLLQSRGNYTMSTWFESVDGAFTVNVTNMNVTAKMTLGPQLDGKLRVQDINIDLAVDTVKTDFGNLGFAGGIFQSVINTGGSFIFDSMKPYMLKDAYTNIRTDVNTKLDKFFGDLQFSNTLCPLDGVILNLRDKVRDMHLDPYQIKDFNQTENFITVNLFNTWLYGISSFNRVGNVAIHIKNNTAVTEFEIGTQELEGTTQWNISTINDFLSNDGTASFSVEYIRTKIILVQPLDTRKKPIFETLDIDVGNIQVRSNGFGTLDYVIELAVNILPNLLRYQIIGAVEGPVKGKLQQELDKLNLEESIKKELPMIDEMKDVKLSDLLSLNVREKVYDKDEFFNF